MTIQQAREAKDMRQVDLASLVLVSVTSISRMENGKPVSKTMLKRICQALDVDPSNIEGVNIIPSVRQGK